MRKQLILFSATIFIISLFVLIFILRYLIAVDVVPLSLQSLSRAVIRTILRKNVELENPNLRKRKRPKRKRRPLRKWLVEPIFDESGEDPFSSDDERRHSVNNRRTAENILDTVMDHLGYRLRQRGDRTHQEEDRPSENRNPASAENDDLMEIEPPPIENAQPEINEARAIINNRTRSNAQEQNTQAGEADQEQEGERPDTDHPTIAGVLAEVEREVTDEIEQVFVNVLQELERDSSQGEDEVEEQLEENMNNLEVINNETDNNRESQTGSNEESTSTKKREKFDSGLGEEIVEKDNQVQESSGNDTMEVDSSSSNEEVEGKRNKRGSKNHSEVRSGAKWRRICLSTHQLDSYSNSSDSDTVQDEASPATVNDAKIVQSPYTKLMRSKIQELPLPTILKNYLNFYREFN